MSYIRVGTVPVNNFLKHVPIEVPDRKWGVMFCGHKITMGSVRYRVYKSKGVACVRCGIEGQFFALERSGGKNNPNKYHANLYALNEYGHEVMMTVDHIIPRSKGGGRILSNLQPMCCNCNSRKGNSNEREDRKHYEESVRA